MNDHACDNSTMKSFGYTLDVLRKEDVFQEHHQDKKQQNNRNGYKFVTKDGMIVSGLSIPSSVDVDDWLTWIGLALEHFNPGLGDNQKQEV